MKPSNVVSLGKSEQTSTITILAICLKLIFFLHEARHVKKTVKIAFDGEFDGERADTQL